MIERETLQQSPGNCQPPCGRTLSASARPNLPTHAAGTRRSRQVRQPETSAIYLCPLCLPHPCGRTLSASARPNRPTSAAGTRRSRQVRQPETSAISLRPLCLPHPCGRTLSASARPNLPTLAAGTRRSRQVWHPKPRPSPIPWAAARLSFRTPRYPRLVLSDGFFDRDKPVTVRWGDLPHWRQDGALYFVTFRLADSLAQARLTSGATNATRGARRIPDLRARRSRSSRRRTDGA